MTVNKLDPKVIFASEAPAQDVPAVFPNKSVGWGESRKNGGRPTIKQMNALQQETDLKILWLNENAVTPYDATIDYPINAVTIKDGIFKIFNGTSWGDFLDKSSVGLSNVDNTSDLNKPISTAVREKLDYIDENGAALPYKEGITYEDGAVVVKDGELQQWKGGVWVVLKPEHNDLGGRDVAEAHPASAILDASGKTQQQINDSIVKKITAVAELSSYKPSAGDIFYIAEKDAYFEVMDGTADNILSFIAGDDLIAKLKHSGEIAYKNIGSTSSNLAYAVNNDTTITKVTGDELVIDNIVQINRDNLELEFNKLTYPETISNGNNALSSLIEFKGDVIDENLDQYILVTNLPEFSEYFPVSDITKFKVGDWVIVSNNTSPQKINYMVQVLGLNVDHIKVDYRLGWTLGAGDTLNFKKVIPISNVKVSISELEYLPSDTRETARAGVLLQYAYNSSVEVGKAVNTFWPVLAGRHTHSCSIHDSELHNPQSTQTGGDGYLVQWQYSLYPQTINNITFADRHLNDFTMCAYGCVVNNQSFNSEDGGFVTHGAYEHDLYYENNVGLLSFANSGVIFGERCKRVFVSKHNGNRVIAKAGVVDLTLNDVVISDYAEINNDGFVSNDLTVLNGITFTSFLPKLSKRKTNLYGGALTLNSSRAIVNAVATGSIVFSKVVIDKFQNQTANGYVDVVFDQCDISADNNANINFLNFKSLKFIGGQCVNFGIRFTDNRDQKIQVLKTEFIGKTSADTFIDNRKTGGVAEMTIDMISTSDVAYHYSVTQSAGRCQLDVIGGKYVGGSVRYLQTTADLAGSYLHIRGTTEEAVTRTLPTESPKVKLGDCLILN